MSKIEDAFRSLGRTGKSEFISKTLITRMRTQ